MRVGCRGRWVGGVLAGFCWYRVGGSVFFVEGRSVGVRGGGIAGFSGV